MSLEDEIVEWGETRPRWQRHVLGRLARGDSLGAEEYREIADALVTGADSRLTGFTSDDLPGLDVGAPRVAIAAIQRVDHVNALVDGQGLTFEVDGLTVVYGDNGSGKSGYARLLKRMVRARHREDVLTDIFNDPSAADPAAEVQLCVDGVVASHAWPASGSEDLRRVSFFDEACGDSYISHDSEVAFRPGPIFLLDGLIQACDGVRAELDRLLAANAARARVLPTVPVDSPGARFLTSLSGGTTTDEIDNACEVPADVEETIRALGQEEVRLRATDPSRERSRLTTVAARYEQVRRHLEGVGAVLTDDLLPQVIKERREATEFRAAADLAASQMFESEPIPGVGSQTWRALWEAARTFAQTEVDRENSFPVAARDARCVLCHQTLDATASDRLLRFEAMVRDETELRAKQAENRLEGTLRRVTNVLVEPPELLMVLEELHDENPEVVVDCRAALAEYGRRRSACLHASPDVETGLSPIVVPEQALVALARSASEAATNTDSTRFGEQLSETVAQRLDLEARLLLSTAQPDLATEVVRLRERGAINELKRSTDTTGITRKTTELTRAHVTAIMRDRFTRESDRLRLERVTLLDTGGQKGQLRHRPAFVGAVQTASIENVLSEGEQTALGLAGYFTEAFLDISRSAMVLDDPVCSLDHIRRERVATRLSEFAKERQVIVFTHDLSFVTELRRAADVAGVELAERTVERRGDGRPGVCLDGHPWKSMGVKARLGELEVELGRMRIRSATATEDERERDAADWAGRLSETWERVIRELVGRVSDQATLEVRPKMFRALAAISVQDDNEFQESYGRVSRWARRHDKSPELNHVAPTINEMTDELGSVRSWYDRVRKYSA